MNTLILIIVLIPLIEIYLFIEIGSQIGALNTILFILLTAILGVYFAKREGLNTLRSGMERLIKNQMSGAALTVAALLLIIPGFATDVLGFLLIIPYTRNFIFRIIGTNFRKTKIKDDLIDGEYEDKDK